MSPGVDRECTTHHYACDCREARFTALLELLDQARDLLQTADGWRQSEGRRIALLQAIGKHLEERRDG